MVSTIEVNLDISLNKIVTVIVQQYSYGSQQILFTITDNGEFYPLNTQEHVCFFQLQTAGQTKIFDRATITDDGKVLFVLTKNCCAFSGYSEGQLMIGNALDESILKTMHFDYVVKPSVYPDEDVTGASEVIGLGEMIVDTKKLINDAIGVSEIVIESKDKAGEYAQKAEASAQNAEASAQNAETSATFSEEKSVESKSYAVGGTGTRENEDTNNAKYYCETASNIKTDVEGLKNSATTSAAEASQSAVEAATSANASNLSATLAENAATAAKESEEKSQEIYENTNNLVGSNEFVGASFNNGKAGLVPAPTVDDTCGILLGDGSWGTLKTVSKTYINTNYDNDGYNMGFQVHIKGKQATELVPDTIWYYQDTGWIDIIGTDIASADIGQPLSTQFPLKYRVINGVLYINGCFSVANKTSGALLLFTLPTDVVPENSIPGMLYFTNTGTGSVMSRYYIKPSGEVALEWARSLTDGTEVTGNISWLGIDITLPLNNVFSNALT